MVVSCSAHHTLTLDDEGNVWAFGFNTHGECGVGNYTQSVTTPTHVKELHNIISISAGLYSSACIDSIGCVWTFGSNNYGQLGHGDDIKRCTPTKVVALAGEEVIMLSAAGCAVLCLTSSNTVYGFGSNGYFQLGIENNIKDVLTPQIIPIDGDIKKVVCGGYHSMFLTFSGDVWVCGKNNFGQLGIGDKGQNTPFLNPHLTNSESIALGSGHSVVMTYDGNLLSFGGNSNGELALEHNYEVTMPQKIEFEEDIISFSCASALTIIIGSSRNVWVFGICSIFKDTQSGYYKGTKLEKVHDIHTISSGGKHVFLKSDEHVWAFGDNKACQIIQNGEKIVKNPTILGKKYFDIIGSTHYKSRQKSARSAMP